MVFKLNLPQKAGETKKVGSLVGASDAALIAEIAEIAVAAKKVVVVLTPDLLSAARLEEELKFFLPQSADIPITHFVDWETLPYDSFSPHKDIISQRLMTLYRLPKLQGGIFIISITTALHRLCPQEYIAKNTLALTVGDSLDLTAIRDSLQTSGYQCVGQVVEHGEFAIRGSILDLFPMGSELPIRVDTFGDEIDSIRYFDPETQLSTGKTESIRLLPAKEFGIDAASISYFRTRWREQFAGDLRDVNIYHEVSQGILSPGLEYYLPLFFAELATIFNYLPAESLLITLGDIEQAGTDFWQEINFRYEQYGHDLTKPILPANQGFIPLNEFFHQLKQYPKYVLTSQELKVKIESVLAGVAESVAESTDVTELTVSSQTTPGSEQEQIKQQGKVNAAVATLPAVAFNVKLSKPLQLLEENIIEQGYKVLICAETAGRKEVLRELLIKYGVVPELSNSWQEFVAAKFAPGKVFLAVAPLIQGMIFPELKLAIVAEADILGYKTSQVKSRKVKALSPEAMIRNLAELTLGTAVVHSEHGVGRYLGLVLLDVGTEQTEFVALEYAGGDKLYVPVVELHLLSRYSSADLEHVPLHALGSSRWRKEKRKALEQAKDAAVELLAIYAKRAEIKRKSFPQPELNYEKFVAGFPFEETPDQQQAIEQIIKDLTSDVPMDRVVCGDVGFGKTEVALRAAFLALQAEKQVAVLVPTTLLAQQHFQTFVDRFVDFPFRIEVLSRFKTAVEQKGIITAIAKGGCDLVIGTHKLLQEDIKFKNLGLLVIDEEHRFGVRQKEKFKALRAEVDILTLTATPIPRTLNMSLANMRDLSIISTPPAKRLSIKTFVREYSESIVSEAITREIMRGGQVYCLHNEVKTIAATVAKLAELVPNARIEFAHGQMPERELEKIMSDFYHRRFNVLVCTTIIETGIDIPSANTIIIERADKFGLAQLHQLRGRVGRSHHQAYAFCLTPNKKAMTKDAIKRLEALESLETLGSGFLLATQDLEIRGAGELLGEAQSGNINTVGFNMFMELLAYAVEALRSGTAIDYDFKLNMGVELDLQLPVLIPDSYVPDVQTRLVLYKRIANAQTPVQLKDLKVELIDRFGQLPVQTQYLFKATALKQKCEALGIIKFKVGPKLGRVDFGDKLKIEPGKIINLVQTEPQYYQFAGPTSIKFTKDLLERDSRIQFVEEFIAKLV